MTVVAFCYLAAAIVLAPVLIHQICRDDPTAKPGPAMVAMVGLLWPVVAALVATGLIETAIIAQDFDDSSDGPGAEGRGTNGGPN